MSYKAQWQIERRAGMAARAASYGWVLVADADAGARAFVRLALEQAGYVVREVPSGAEALAAIRT